VLEIIHPESLTMTIKVTQYNVIYHKMLSISETMLQW